MVAIVSDKFVSLYERLKEFSSFYDLSAERLGRLWVGYSFDGLPEFLMEACTNRHVFHKVCLEEYHEFLPMSFMAPVRMSQQTFRVTNSTFVSVFTSWSCTVLNFHC